MMAAGQLSLGESPRLAVPARFFVTAPLFGVLAAALMLWAGPGPYAVRWSTSVLAATHLLTLGYMAMVMFGALMQVFPVVVGQSFPRARGVSVVVHLLLTVGVALLVLGFLIAPARLTGVAAVVLAAAAGVLLAAAAAALARVGVRGPAARALALALAALLVTAGLGVWLALAYGGAVPPALGWVDDHVAWGLAGWLPLLVMAVGYQVVPMFQLTPAYPRWLRRGLGSWVFAGLALGVALRHAPVPAWAPAIVFGLVAGALAAFAGVTLELQRRRRRRLPDATVWYWQLGMAVLLAAAALWVAGRCWPALAADPRWALLLGALMILGFAIPVINGMLYKIVPFLVWLHLALAPGGGPRPEAGSAPHMRQIIPPRRAKAQFLVYAAGLALLLAGVAGAAPAFRPGAALFGIACLLLGKDILLALRVYAAAAGRPPHVPDGGVTRAPAGAGGPVPAPGHRS